MTIFKSWACDRCFSVYVYSSRLPKDWFEVEGTHFCPLCAGKATYGKDEIEVAK